MTKQQIKLTHIDAFNDTIALGFCSRFIDVLMIDGLSLPVESNFIILFAASPDVATRIAGVLVCLGSLRPTQAGWIGGSNDNQVVCVWNPK